MTGFGVTEEDLRAAGRWCDADGCPVALCGGPHREALSLPFPEDHWKRKATPPAVLEGAAAIERARQMWAVPVVLVWRDERGGEISRSGPLEPGTCKVGIPLEAEHVDVIAAEGP